MAKRGIIYNVGDVVGGYRIVKMLKPYIPPGNPKQRVQKARFKCLECGVEKDCIIYKVNTGARKICGCWKQPKEVESKDIKFLKGNIVDRVVGSAPSVGRGSRMSSRHDVGQAEKLLKEIYLKRQGKRYRLIKIDWRTWKEVEIR